MLTTEKGTEATNCKAPNDPAPSDQLSKRLLPHIAIIITLLTAFLYFLGRSYHDAYFSFWGLPEDLFSISKEDSVISAIIQYVVLVLTSAKPIIITLVALVIALYLFLITCYKPVYMQLTKPFRVVANAISTRADNFIVTPEHDRLFAFIQLVLISSISILVIFLFLFPSLKLAYKQGTAAAQKRYEAIISGKATDKPFSSTATIYIKNDSKGYDEFSGHLIQTSATHCALYDPAKGLMIFPLSSVSRLVVHENSKQ